MQIDLWYFDNAEDIFVVWCNTSMWRQLSREKVKTIFEFILLSDQDFDCSEHVLSFLATPFFHFFYDSLILIRSVYKSIKCKFEKFNMIEKTSVDKTSLEPVLTRGKM